MTLDGAADALSSAGEPKQVRDAEILIASKIWPDQRERGARVHVGDEWPSSQRRAE